MKRKLASIMTAALILTPALSANISTVNAAYQPYSVSSASDTVSLAEYDDGLLIDHVVFYPKEMTTSNKKYPVVVWGNGTTVSWDVYEELLSQIAAAGYIVVANMKSVSLKIGTMIVYTNGTVSTTYASRGIIPIAKGDTLSLVEGEPYKLHFIPAK